MDVGKLKVGMEFKNYKELCDFLGENVKTGKSKMAQFSMWESYFKYEKNGHKILIDQIFDEPKGKMTKYGFINDVEELVLNLIIQEKHGGQVLLSKNQLFKTLKLTNDNYNFGRYHISKLSSFTQIQEHEIHEFYDLSKNALVRCVESALKSLANKSMVYWSSAITVCRIDSHCKTNQNGIKAKLKRYSKNEYGDEVPEYEMMVNMSQTHIEATQDEVKAILVAERKAIQSLGCKDKRDVISKGLWNKYIEQVKESIFNSHNILYYYDSYKIICNEEYIVEFWKDIKSLSLTESAKRKNETNVNLFVQKKLTDNADKRQQKQRLSLVEDKYKYRVSDNYVENVKKLTDYLIDITAIDLKKELKAFKKKA